jgi:hypothetical protein
MQQRRGCLETQGISWIWLQKRRLHGNFLILLKQESGCSAGNLVRWEVGNKKREGRYTSLKLRVDTVIEKVPHLSGVQGVRAAQDFFHGFQALLLQLQHGLSQCAALLLRKDKDTSHISKTVGVVAMDTAHCPAHSF